MMPSQTKQRPRRAGMRGASLITAIFLLVVLSGLAVAMVTLSTTQQASSAMDVQGARAYLAARAGMEWGVFRASSGSAWGVYTGVLPNPNACGTTTFALPAGTKLADFSVTVVCTQSVSGTIVRHRVEATACNQPRPAPAGCLNASSNHRDYVERVLQVEF